MDQAAEADELAIPSALAVKYPALNDLSEGDDDQRVQIFSAVLADLRQQLDAVVGR